MATNILVKRGSSSSFSSLVLKAGEPAFVTDTNKLYVGNGAFKVLINPIDKPAGLDVASFYSKMKVNDYGQVISQSSLVVADIPSLPYTKITGLGTTATLNTGTSSGNVPVLNASGKLSSDVLPTTSTSGYAMAYYTGNDGTSVAAGRYVPLNSFSTSDNINFSLESNGLITIKLAGTYLISYSISSNVSAISTSLGDGTTFNLPGSYARSSATAVPSFVNTSATVIKKITTVPEKVGIRNNGTTPFSMLSPYGCLTISRMG